MVLSQVSGMATLAQVPPSKKPFVKHAPPQSTLPPYVWSAQNPHARLLYIRDPNLADAALWNIRSATLGFDLEWKPTFVKNAQPNPVALCQIATQDAVLLIQVSAMQEFPSKLKEILESPNIIKTGVGIQHDAQKLWKDYSISTRNCVDLSLLARSVDNQHWKGKYSSPIGLARLVETYEHLSLPKGKTSRSNWEALLSDKQQQYAANDAHSGMTLYHRLVAMADRMQKIPQRSCYTFDVVRGRVCEQSGMVWYPHNPDYDPGPPPPPKEPRPPTKSVQATASTASTSSSVPSRSTQLPVPSPPARPTRRHQPIKGESPVISSVQPPITKSSNAKTRLNRGARARETRVKDPEPRVAL